MRDGDIIHGLMRGLSVIECFDEDHARMSITDVAARTGLERATARRCLLTLVHLGYATYDGKFFELTPRVLNLGHSYLAATPLPRLIQPFLEEQVEGRIQAKEQIGGRRIGKKTVAICIYDSLPVPVGFGQAC